MRSSLKFISELQMMKRKKREGVRTCGVDRPNSLADHSFIVAHLAMIIAFHEGADIDRCIKMALFHDLGEARIGDNDKITKGYCGSQVKEQKEAISDQVSVLPEELSTKIESLFSEKEDRETKEAIVVQDADWLEAAIQAKTYLEMGYKEFEMWLKNIEKALATESANKIMEELMETDSFIGLYHKK